MHRYSNICRLTPELMNLLKYSFFYYGHNCSIPSRLSLIIKLFPVYVCHNLKNTLQYKTMNLHWSSMNYSKSRKENPQKLTQLSSRSHPRHLVEKKTAQKDTIRDITSDSQVNSNFPYRWSPASLTFNNYFYLFLYLYLT